jgi:hypothetical protein
LDYTTRREKMSKTTWNDFYLIDQNTKRIHKNSRENPAIKLMKGVPYLKEDNSESDNPQIIMHPKTELPMNFMITLSQFKKVKQAPI